MVSKFKNEVPTDSGHPRLPMDGWSRWSDIEIFIPFSKELWRQLSRDGFAPPVIRFTPRCSFQENREILLWLKNPKDYRAKGRPIDFHSTFGRKS